MLSPEFLLWFLNWVVTLWLIGVAIFVIYYVFIIVVVSAEAFIEWKDRRKK